MKLVNSRDLDKLLEELGNPKELYDFGEEETRSPCWQISIDKERNKIVFLVDSKELLSHTLDDFNPSEFSTAVLFTKYIQILREEGLVALKKELQKRRK